MPLPLSWVLLGVPPTKLGVGLSVATRLRRVSTAIPNAKSRAYRSLWYYKTVWTCNKIHLRITVKIIPAAMRDTDALFPLMDFVPAKYRRKNPHRITQILSKLFIGYQRIKSAPLGIKNHSIPFSSFYQMKKVHQIFTGTMFLKPKNFVCSVLPVYGYWCFWPAWVHQHIPTHLQRQYHGQWL